MLSVFEKRGARGEFKETGLGYSTAAGTVWIDAFNPTDDELEAISKKTHIPVVELSEYVDPNERPHVRETELYSRIVFSYPIKEKSIRVAPVFIFLYGRQGILTLHKKELPAKEKIISYMHNHPSVMDSSVSFLHYFIDALISDFFDFFEHLEENVDSIERQIIKNEAKTTSFSTQEIFNIKKIFILFHKALLANRDVVTGVEKGYLAKMTKNETERFRDIYYDIVQLIDVGDTNREILTGVLETYLTILSNNMNNIIKRLSGYAALILVPTLISGIYGMNFRYLPETQWRLGYPFALGLMVLSIILLYIFFKRREWI